MTTEALNQIIIKITDDAIVNEVQNSRINTFDYTWLINSISSDYLPEDLNSPSILLLLMLAFKAFLFTDPLLNNEHLVFITKPLISGIDYLLDILINFNIIEFTANTVLFIPLVFAHDIFISDDILDPSKNLLFFSNSAHLNFYINFSIIDNRLLFLKSEKLSFGKYLYNFSINFTYISASNKITLGCISFDVLYVLRFLIFLLLTLTLLFFVNVKYLNQLNVYFVSFYKYFYSKSYQLGMDYRFTLLAFSLLFSYWFFIILNYDENSYSFIEVLDSWLFYCFVFAAILTLFKLSFYALSVLEVIRSSESTFALLVSQFGRDVFAWYSLVLRIASLLLRMTLYDILDDFIESYYVFFDDFIDDADTTVLLLSFYEDNNSFDLSNRNQSLDFNEKFFYTFDFYITYINILQGLFMFWFFLIEELFKLLLGIFITYMILIEIYSGLLSYSESKITK